MLLLLMNDDGDDDDAGWPLTWKTWKSQGIPKWSGKMEKVRETEICLLDFERAEELKLQLVGLDFGYVHH